MSQKVPKMKPHFVFSQTIDGFHSLRKSSLKQYKHLSKLKLIKFSEEMNQNQKLLLSNKLLPLRKNIKNLDLSRYYALESYTLSQIKSLAKRFNRITRLSLIGGGDEDSEKSLFLAKTMLKKAKNLKSLYLEDVLQASSSQSQQFLQRMIPQSKLKTLNLIPKDSSKYEPKWLLNFSNYCPPSIEELFLYWKERIDGPRLKFSRKKHLDNLQKLELRIPIALNTFTKVIIEAIQDPSKLKSLQLQLEKSKKNESFSPEVLSFLENCVNLEELSLRTDIDVYPNSSMAKLKIEH